MTREQAKQNLIACGIAEPTEEAITNYLNQVNGAVKVEKDRADKLKADADEVASLRKQIEEINNNGLSDVEKANKATEAANAKIADLEKTLKTMQTKTKLAEIGIVGEQAEKFFGADGDVDFGVLGQVLANVKAEAATAKERELASKAGNPGGGKPEGQDKTEAEKIAESVGKAFADNSKETADILANYINN